MSVVITPAHLEAFSKTVHQAVSAALAQLVTDTGVCPSAILIETVDLTGDPQLADKDAVVIGGIQLRFDR